MVKIKFFKAEHYRAQRVPDHRCMAMNAENQRLGHCGTA